MNEIHVMGRSVLSGSVSIQGSKNAALPMMAASLMHKGLSILQGCPRISDVFCMEEILKNLGAVTWWENHDLYLDCTGADGTMIPEQYTGRMRSSVILLAPVLCRNRRCQIGYPGGCVIGKRPIDLHLMALRCLGADIKEEKNCLNAECKKFRGNEIFFCQSSVGATQQAVLASVLAEGETYLHGCAREPEIIWLCLYLKSMGADIEGIGTESLFIHGVKTLGPGIFKVPPDRIVAGTYICAAAAARSTITIQNAPEGELKSFLEVYQKMGGQYEGKSGTLKVNGEKACNPVPLVETGIYPGFPTDLQAPLMAVLAGIPGESRIRETIFDDRFGSALQMRKMGAQIDINGNTALIRGTERLRSSVVNAGDLRGGAALILAALMAEGETCIRGADFISRGYEHICEDLEVLGCQIWQSSDKGNEHI